MKAIVFDHFGDESVLRWDKATPPTCGAGQVLVRVVSTAVNNADLLQRRGFYPPPEGASEILGLEAAGRITEVGDGVEGYSIGDEVMALLAGGGYAELVAVDARHLMPVPKPIGLPDSGAIPEVFLTAFLNLCEIGELKAGQRVLIHGGSGGVGNAALQIAHKLGAEVWTTAGSEERVERCLELGADHGINHREQDFLEVVQAAGGVDLILDVMGASYVKRNLKALVPDGKLVIIGLQGGVNTDINLGYLLGKRISVIGSTLRGRSDDDKARIIAVFRSQIWPYLDAGDYRLVIDRRMPLRNADAAHRLMARGGHFGKILLTI